MRQGILAGALAAVLLLAAGAAAQLSVGPETAPASVLLFPYYDSRTTKGQATVVAVANTNASRLVVPTNNLLKGDVELHYYFINCASVTNVIRKLSPNDLLVELTNVLTTPSANEKGALLVVAQDPETGKAIDFDYLVGDAIMVDVAGNRTWAYKALGFRALAEERNQTGARSQAGFLFTDDTTNGGDGKGDVDFDGVEYAYFPQILYVSSFLENKGSSTTYDNHLALVALYATDVRIEVSGNVYANTGDSVSWTNSFSCWTLWDLYDDISTAVGSVQKNTAEEAMGWIRISADQATDTVTGGVAKNPGIAGVLVQQVTATSFMFGHLLHYGALAQSGQNFHAPAYPGPNIKS